MYFTGKTFRPRGGYRHAAGRSRVLAAVLGLLALGGVAQAATITVNSLDDPNPGTTLCVLRDAITAANTEAAVNGCAAGSGNDTIAFSSGLTGTITLGSTLPAIVNTLTIQGPAATAPAITISGNNAVQVMVVNPGATLNLNDLTVADGEGGHSQGGGILNEGTLTVANSAFADNNSSNGGGIANVEGTLTVTNSTFSGNIANSLGGGGGITSFEGTLTVINSTFSGNVAGLGGGIANADGTLKVTNSTFSGNSAVGGGPDASGGGAINNFEGTASLEGVIVAASAAGNNCSGSIFDQGYNLSDDGSCDFSGTSLNDVTTLNLDPSGLQNNGGPTQTIALESGSAALDYIPVAQCTYQNVNPCTNPPTISSGSSGPLVCDQRDEPRPSPGQTACDVGAFELQQTVALAQFQAALAIDLPDTVGLIGTFVPATGATINPVTQALTVTFSSAELEPVSLTIPAGSFKKGPLGVYSYTGAIGGVKVVAAITPQIKNTYGFVIAANGLDLTGVTNPVTVSFQLGNNIGTASVKALIE